MSRIYFAGPLFCAAEKDFNAKITAILEAEGYSVFLPQRDGVLAAELENKTESETVEIVFKRDFSEIEKCDILLTVLDGRTPDEGAAVELGIAYAMKKRCYGIKTDVRSLERGLDVNPLISGCLIKLFRDPDVDKLLTEFKEYLKTNKL